MSFLFNKDDLGNKLIEAGYRFTNSTESMRRGIYGESFCGLYQKKITYVGGISYFININKHDFNLIPKIPLDGYTYDVSIQTYYNRRADVDVALNFNFNPEGMTIAETEDLVEKFFINFGRDYE